MARYRHSNQMKHIFLSVYLLFWIVTTLFGQTGYRRFSASLDLGGATPHHDLRPFFNSDLVVGGSFGYRFHRYFQADVGYDVVFGAAGVEDYLNTGIGAVRIRDRQYFVPFGGRAILPFADGKVLLYGGGGGAYMRYSETLKQPSDEFTIECPYCQSRDGWGYYAVAGISYALNYDQNFRVGFLTKTYRGNTEGQGLGTLPGRKTKDAWVNYMGEFSFCF